MLQVHELNVSYGKIRALRDVSIEVNEGELLAIIGANGAGKSTLLNTIAGALKPTSGTITYRGEEINSYSPPQRVKMGMILMPEGRAIFGRITVAENLKLGALHRKDKQVAQDIEEILDQFPALKERRNRKAGSLSGGEKQMLAVGRALMARPKLLLLDEPSLGLAPLMVKSVFDNIKKMHGQGLTICLVEQNARQALKIADRAYVLETGRVVLSGPARELAENEAVKEAYLGVSTHQVEC